jgi:hypothetical protein
MSCELGALRLRDAGAPRRVDLPKRNLRSFFAMQKEKVFVGHMIFRKQVLGRATRTGSGGNAADAARCAAFQPSTTSPPSGS